MKRTWERCSKNSKTPNRLWGIKSRPGLLLHDVWPLSLVLLVDRRRNGTATVGGGGGGEDLKRQHRSCFWALGSQLLQQRSTTTQRGQWARLRMITHLAHAQVMSTVEYWVEEIPQCCWGRNFKPRRVLKESPRRKPDSDTIGNWDLLS